MGRFVVIKGEVVDSEATMKQSIYFHDFTEDELIVIEDMYNAGYPDNYDYFDDAYCIY